MRKAAVMRLLLYLDSSEQIPTTNMAAGPVCFCSKNT